MDNNEVYALFEDIKSGLKSINNKLEKYSESKQQPVRRTASVNGFGSHKGIAEYFCQRKPGTD
jgi:hypothetical protein